MGIKSIFSIFKFKWWKLTLFGGWGGRYHAILDFYNDHTVAFYAIIIIILLIVVYVIYLESNSEEDYLIRPYQVLLGISLVAIVIYIIATAPEQKDIDKLEYFKYGEYVDPYKKEKDWILHQNKSCPKSGDEKDIKYCSEIKEACSEIIILLDKKVSTCVAEVRERLGMPPIEVKGGCDIDSKIIMDINKRYDIEPRISGSGETDIYGNTRTVETDLFGNTTTVETDMYGNTRTVDTKINWGNIYNAPFTNFESIKKSIKKRWGTMSSEQKLSIVLNVVVPTCTTYDQFPDWMKNDPLIMEIKEELQQINSDN